MEKKNIINFGVLAAVIALGATGTETNETGMTNKSNDGPGNQYHQPILFQTNLVNHQMVLTL
ncbi:hypothetical protein M153_3520006568 [Pseudoloma neurophilia]|uniref:Uncharacterized protein n=1 Tax=Pseudoloma neurophilia TaxID=146866 RepID=A0A0R0LYI3_9MICR|nr:hypothetical protein M153_3520006568 [Pseudoloma neurophilia]